MYFQLAAIGKLLLSISWYVYFIQHYVYGWMHRDAVFIEISSGQVVISESEMNGNAACIELSNG